MEMKKMGGQMSWRGRGECLLLCSKRLRECSAHCPTRIGWPFMGVSRNWYHAYGWEREGRVNTPGAGASSVSQTTPWFSERLLPPTHPRPFSALWFFWV